MTVGTSHICDADDILSFYMDQTWSGLESRFVKILARNELGYAALV